MLLAFVVLLGLAASASAEELPSITKPADQTSTIGNAKTVIVHGERLAELSATGLPAGVPQPTKVSPTEWKIEGTATTAEVASVTLEAKNEEKKAGPTVTFKWTVQTPEPLPTIVKPEDQTSVAGKAKTVVITGERLSELTATGLPAGVPQPTKVSPTEWKIEGTATTAEVASVTLEAKNEEKKAGPTVAFKWTVQAPESLPTIEKPADQVSIAGTTIATLIVKGTNLTTLSAPELPKGLVLKASAANPETEWEIIGTPTTVKAATTVTLEASNKEESPIQTTTFQWTIKEAEAPAAPPVTPTPQPFPSPSPSPPIAKITSAGRLGTVPTQKPGKALMASFLCEVAACRVLLTATVTAGKSKFKIRSAAIAIKPGQKAKIALKLNKKQQALVAAALKKHAKVSVALAASIESTVGFQVTRVLTITVRK